MGISLILIFIIFLIGIIYTLFSDQIKEMQYKQKNSDNSTKTEVEKENQVISTDNQKNNLSELSDQHHADERIIVIFKDLKYDITNFTRKHPGGKQVLLENNGKDIENLMLENEHSTHAYEILEKYKIKE